MLKRCSFGSLLFSILVLLSIPQPLPFLDVPADDTHRGSMILMSGLYAHCSNLLPVRDIFSQYGAGQGFAGQFFQSDTFLDSQNNFSYFHFTLRLFFFVCLYFLAKRLLASRGWAAIVTASCFLLAFSGNVQSTVTLYFPSVGPYRYFLLGLALCILPKQLEIKFPWARLLGTAFLFGIGLFWSTDAGAAVLVSTVAGFVVIGVFTPSKMLKYIAASGILLVGAFVSFLLVCFAAYGSGFLDISVIKGVFLYPIYYAVGGWSVVRNPYDDSILSYVINYLCVGWAIISIAFALFDRRWGRRSLQDSSILLVVLSLIALFMNFKYINRSFTSYWCNDAFAFLLLGAFWLQRWVKSVRVFRPLSIRVAAAACLLWVVGTKVVDASSAYGLPILLHSEYMWISHALNRAFPDSWNVRKPVYPDRLARSYISDLERAAIESRVPAGKSPLILSKGDWVYYSELKRCPAYYMLPAYDNIHLKRDVVRFREAIAQADYYFDRENLLADARFHALYAAQFTGEFEFEIKVDRLNIFKRTRAGNGKP